MNEIREFCTQYAFPDEAVTVLDAAWETLQGNESAYRVFLDQIEVYKNDMNFDYHPVLDALHALEEATGIHSYTIDLLFIIQLMPLLKAHYIERGYPLRYYDGFANNLRDSLIECHTVHGVWGNYILWWLVAFFKLKCFSIGRLQFKPKRITESRAYPQFPLTVGQPYLEVHIPTGGSLRPELCHASYAEAASFFREHFGYTEAIFYCCTWLLSPELDEILPATSNILAFSHTFQLLETRIDTDYRYLLRCVFNTLSMPEDLNDLPEDSSLQQEFKARLMAGRPTLLGIGAFRFEP